MVIYLKHPVHGSKVASAEFEAEEDKKNGWVVYDPTALVSPVIEPVAVPDFLAPQPKGKGGRPRTAK